MIFCLRSIRLHELNVQVPVSLCGGSWKMCIQGGGYLWIILKNKEREVVPAASKKISSQSKLSKNWNLLLAIIKKEKGLYLIFLRIILEHQWLPTYLKIWKGKISKSIKYGRTLAILWYYHLVGCQGVLRLIWQVQEKWEDPMRYPRVLVPLADE